MKKVVFVVLAGFFLVATPVFAQTNSDVQSDVQAERKDNAALSKDQANLAANRAAKAHAKATGSSVDQAVDSVKIGANQSAISEKKTEKGADQQITDHDTEQ